MQKNYKILFAHVKKSIKQKLAQLIVQYCPRLEKSSASSQNIKIANSLVNRPKRICRVLINDVRLKIS